jgi:peptidoglycan/xylan/chitin deacetylase (PgdA/CDA1 family)
MSATGCATVITYHAIAAGPPPLCIPPDLFESHVDALAEARVSCLTISELADGLRSGMLPERAVAVTFDDAYAGVAEHAAPLLARHGFRATVYAVAGYLGGASDWPTQPASAPRLPLAGVAQLRGLASAGWEIGSHGNAHDPLDSFDPEGVERELADSRATLEETVGAPVSSFAFPYGVVPPGAPDALLATGFTSACTTRLDRVRRGDDPLLLPRVDAHYLRRPALLREVVSGRFAVYLRARRAASGVRRVVARG